MTACAPRPLSLAQRIGAIAVLAAVGADGQTLCDRYRQPVIGRFCRGPPETADTQCRYSVRNNGSLAFTDCRTACGSLTDPSQPSLRCSSAHFSPIECPQGPLNLDPSQCDALPADQFSLCVCITNVVAVTTPPSPAPTSPPPSTSAPTFTSPVTATPSFTNPPTGPPVTSPPVTAPPTSSVSVPTFAPTRTPTRTPTRSPASPASTTTPQPPTTAAPPVQPQSPGGGSGTPSPTPTPSRAPTTPAAAATSGGGGGGGVLIAVAVVVAVVLLTLIVLAVVMFRRDGGGNSNQRVTLNANPTFDKAKSNPATPYTRPQSISSWNKGGSPAGGAAQPKPQPKAKAAPPEAQYAALGADGARERPDSAVYSALDRGGGAGQPEYAALARKDNPVAEGGGEYAVLNRNAAGGQEGAVYAAPQPATAGPQQAVYAAAPPGSVYSVPESIP
eukprot:m.105343 g.105343  ORF g.105343 m.105343 type:complete len:445 (+) comp12643_c0_seq1:177-1511(+)